jgi:hypothetical protein
MMIFAPIANDSTEFNSIQFNSVLSICQVDSYNNNNNLCAIEP